MKCNNCRAEWNISAAMSASIITCPFCGADLYPKATGELDSLQAVLKVIIAHGGTEALKDGRRTLAMFSDLAPKLRKEKTMYSYLVQVGGNVILLEALNKSRSEQLTLRGRLAQDMVDTFLIAEAVAFAACDSFWEAIGGEPLEQKQEVSEPPRPVSTTVATGISTKPTVPSITPQNISDDKAAQYQDALALFNVALTKEEFQQTESAFRSLGSYSNAAQMAAQVSSEWSSRSKRAQELYQAYQVGSTGRDPAAAVDSEIAELKAQKAELERVQNSAPTLKSELESKRKARNDISAEILRIKQEIGESATNHSPSVDNANHGSSTHTDALKVRLSHLEAEHRTICQKVSAAQDALNKLPSSNQKRNALQEIEYNFRKKALEDNRKKRNALSSEIIEIKKQISEYVAAQPKGNNGTRSIVFSENDSCSDRLRILEEKHRVICQEIAAAQDSLNQMPADYQTRARISEIDAKIHQKLAARAAIFQHAFAGLSDFNAVKQQICEPKYLAILSSEPVKAMVLNKDPVISAAMARITKTPSVSPAPSTSFDQSLEGMLRLVQSNSKVTEAERLQIFQEGKQLLATGDKAQAIKLIKFAANKGLQDASLLIGECYETGNGVSKDLKIAEAFYRSVAVSGNHEGEYRLGKMLYHPQNRYGANTWLEKAARAGHRGADNLLKYGR